MCAAFDSLLSDDPICLLTAYFWTPSCDTDITTNGDCLHIGTDSELPAFESNPASNKADLSEDEKQSLEAVLASGREEEQLRACDR